MPWGNTAASGVWQLTHKAKRLPTCMASSRDGPETDTVFGLPVGHLAYARGIVAPARHVLRQSGIQILCHAGDLRQPPEQLIGQLNNLDELITA